MHPNGINNAMVMPYNLQRLPREALEVLRYMLTQHNAQSPAQIESGAGISARLVGKAIRRLVNFGQIELRQGMYVLTEDGRITARQLLEYEAAQQGQADGAGDASFLYMRRLTMVVPRSLRNNTPADIFIGINAPNGDDRQLPETAQISLRLSAVGGQLSGAHLSMNVPPDKAAVPNRLSLTPTQAGRPVRVRVDAFQIIDLDEAHPLGGMYFDVQVPITTEAPDRAVRAVGMDLMLKTK